MVFTWIVALIAVAMFVATGFADSWCAKSKSSTYYERMKIPTGKELREANIPDTSKYDSFYSGLNARQIG